MSNPIKSKARQDFLKGLEPKQRSQVTRVFLGAIIPGISEPEHLTAAVRHQAMGKGFVDSHPTLAPWLVTMIDEGDRALSFARWCIEWQSIPHWARVQHLADMAEEMGADSDRG